MDPTDITDGAGERSEPNDGITALTNAARLSLPTKIADSVESAGERASVRVASSAKLQFVIESIPFIGPRINNFLAVEGQRLIDERFERLISELGANLRRLAVEVALQGEEIDTVAEAVLDADFYTSEAGLAIVQQVLVATAQEHEKEKIRYYASILLGAGRKDRRPNDMEPDAALNALLELSAREVGLLQLIADTTAGGAAWPQPNVSVPDEIGVDHIFHLQRIERTGLISRIPGFDSARPEARYEPTPTLGRLLGLLKEGGFAPAESEVPADQIAPESGCIFCGATPELQATPSAHLLTLQHDDGHVETVEMPSRIDLCSSCSREMTSGQRDFAACPACRRWGPEGRRCASCSQTLISIRD